MAGQALARVSPELLLRAYRQSSRRLILLGLDGTLIQNEKVIAYLKNFQDFEGHALSPPPAALHCLRSLAADPLNTIHVISSRGAADMETCLGSIDGLGLAAELGFLQSAPSAATGEGRRSWMRRDLTEAQSGWRDVIKPVLELYTVRTNGAYICWGESEALWCYQNADPDFGRFQARQLALTLREKLAGAEVSVSHRSAKGRVEVRIAGVNKGVVADEIMCAAQCESPLDFVLAIGNCDADEYMLSAVTARATSAEMRQRLHRRLFTITVGSKAASHAGYLVDTPREVLRLLETIRDGQ